MSTQKPQQQQPPQLPMGILMITGGFSACVAEFLTIPMDTAKVRLQIQKSDSPDAYKGVMDCIKRMAAEEGVKSLWSGCLAGFQRQLVFASIRLGLYEPVRNYFSGGSQETGVGVKIASGLTTGTIAMMVASPTDLVKVRLQAQGIAARNDPSKIRYTSIGDAYSKILKQEGVLGFWTGVGPNILRNAVINACELATFDQVKQTILSLKLMEDNAACNLVSSSVAGFVATTVGSPVDVIKTRIMNAPAGASIAEVLTNLVKKEGLGAFYNGYIANAQRIVCWNIAMQVTWGQVKKSVGQKYQN